MASAAVIPSLAPRPSDPIPVTRIGYANGKQMLAEGPSALHEHFAKTLAASIGRPLPLLEVRFKNLSLSADIVVADDKDTSKPELPTLANEIKRAVVKVRAKKFSVRKEILKEFNGVLRPGTMTLVLGQPSSGKSAFLKVLSGRFRMTKNIHLTGDISYNGIKEHELRKQLPQMVSYVTQRDHHFATLTVKETFQFAHACCGGELLKILRPRLSVGSPDQNQKAVEAVGALVQYFPDIVIQYLGLENCQNTVVGNAMLRGVSGGERKRVTTGEMEFGRTYAKFMDEITTGLDSAAAFDILSAQRSNTKRLNKTVVISLLQPSPEIFELFDDVIILNEGDVMYHGPREKAVEYFERIGFKRPAHRDVADFLMDLGTNMQHQYQVEPSDTVLVPNKVHPKTAGEFAEVFRRSEIYQKTLHDLEEPWAPNLLEDGKMISNTREFHQPLGKSTTTLLDRQMKITIRNKPFLMGRTIMTVVMGLLYASTYYQFDPTNVQVVTGMIFSSIMFTALGQASQLPTFMEFREIFYKQRAANFYRTSSYVFSNAVSRIPVSVIEAVVFGTLVYWMCGFTNRADCFIIFLVLLILTVLCFGSFFFLLSAIAPDLHIAKPMAMVSILFLILSGGFIISPHNMPDYFVWVYWINPIAWSFRALSVNQYINDDYNVNVYRNVDYMTHFHKTMGQYYLDVFGIPSEKKWISWCVVYLIAVYFVFVLLSYLVLEYVRYEHAENAGVVTKKKRDPSDHVIDKIIPLEDTAGTSSVPSGGGAKVLAIENSTIPVAKKNFIPVTLAFQDLWYSVPAPGKRHEFIDLLKGISGYALPGTVTALMGSSGAGKTTLMDVIAGRKTGGKIRGKILLNGFEANELAIRRATGYCEQMDIHSESSTIREALTFSAFLRQSSTVSDSVKYESVDECLDLLGLEPIADKIIRGSSVEQMKRLTIGVELAAQPSVLFLDEPTSGLDARSAKLIMDGVRKVANTGRTIVCTIHQPSAEVFHVFDNLLLLKRGGQTVFFGELGDQSSKMVEYFERIPSVAPLPEDYNPATWMLEVIGAGVGNAAAQGKDFVQIFNDSDNKKHLDQMMNQEGVTRPAPDVKPIVFASRRAATNWTQFRFIMIRFIRMYWRTASYNLTRFFIGIFLALLFGVVYLNVEYSTFSGINSAVGMVFLTTSFVGIVAMNSILPIVAEERPSYYRERSCETYNALWYFVASTLIEIPYVFFCTLAFTSIFYPMVGFIGFKEYLLYWLEVSVLVLLMGFIGQMLVVATPSVEVAAIFGVLINSICFLFTGFNPPASAIPRGYKWLYQIVPQRYILSFLLADVFGSCPTPGGKELGCQIIPDAPGILAKLTVKEYLEAVFNIHHHNMWRDFGIALAILVAVRLFTLYALRYLCFQKR